MESGETVEKMVESDGDGETIAKELKRPLDGKHGIVAVAAAVVVVAAAAAAVAVAAVVVAAVAVVAVVVAAAVAVVVRVVVLRVVVLRVVADVVQEEESLYSVRHVYLGLKNKVLVLQRQGDVEEGMVEVQYSWILWV